MTDLHAISRAPLVTGGVLGVFAHPDDETLGAGGLLASAASAGVASGSSPRPGGPCAPVRRAARRGCSAPRFT
ncbi:hypothetical protein [Georgenia sp. SUBG003]|uniref:hypothetical protein n=1 Tax=Georgenia sp. SUBG003 TaxID=1497974 RepID=UPI003AB65638